MKTTIFLFALLCVVSVFALDCPGCDKSKCPKVDCKFGVTTDVCGCCAACFKGIGEVCGGPWNIHGICTHYSVCVRRRRPDGKTDPVFDFNADGKCSPLME